MSRADNYVSWSEWNLWRDDITRVWGKSILVTMHAVAPSKNQRYADEWRVWATSLCGRMPQEGDLSVRRLWPSDRFTSVPAMLVNMVIELDRMLAEREAERRTQTAF